MQYEQRCSQAYHLLIIIKGKQAMKNDDAKHRKMQQDHWYVVIIQDMYFYVHSSTTKEQFINAFVAIDNQDLRYAINYVLN